MAVAGGILANGVTEILKKLSSVVANEITLVRDFKDELKNLQSTLEKIQAVMEDAEKKRLSSKDVELWMEDFRATAYDAIDILDEYDYEVRNASSSSKPSFVVKLKLGHKVKKINEKLNKIAKRKNDFGLETIYLGSSSSQHELMMKNRETYSFVPNWKIVGRENDKSNIIKMLLDEEENSTTNQGDGGKNVSVIPIVGMGGLGKTTLAQQVYNDEEINTHFGIKVWICVSDPFEVKKLLTNIASSIGVAATQYDVMVCQLRKALEGKKFLLVLDDVWNENFEDWHKLITPLMGGAKGSKILVTARNVTVAKVIGDKFPHYELRILNPDDSWSLFKQLTFGYANGVEETPKLVEIGKEMVEKCGGLPLAVIFLGGLMRSKETEEEWKIIRDTKVWHEYGEGKNSEILPSLRLSYDYLPSHLKLCFSYCCLFPKDSIIKIKRLIRLWMAEGFLIETPEENTMSMEEIGNEYFRSLLSSFFFLDAEKDEDGDIETCKMHDLVHDLARSVVGKNECLIVENADEIDCISEETRRLNLVNLLDGILPKVLKAVKKAKNLRTILVDSVRRFDFDIGNAFKENKRLRVLDLNWTSVTKSNSSIGGLKHLRYLQVYRAYFPKGIGRLRFLQTLNEFNVGDKKKKLWNASVIGELAGLNLLSGDLRIVDLQNVTSEIDARRANLKEKKNLRQLKLSWSYGRNAKNADAVVLEELRPHPNLRILWISGFQGSKFPRWFIEDSSSCLPYLVHLVLFGSDYIEQVAGFGALPSLRSLTLWGMEKVECIGNEFYYSAAAGGGGGESSTNTTTSSEASTAAAATTTIAFPSLKKLNLTLMRSLKEWVVPVRPPHASTTTTTTGGATTNYCFPLLEEIYIDHCYVLATITPPTTIFPSLKVLNLCDIDGRSAEVETLVTNHLNSLTSLTLREIPNLVSLPRQGLIENNNTLLSLEITNCPKFEGFFPPNNDDDDVREVVGEGGGQQLQQQISQVVSSSSSSSSSLQTFKLYDCPVMRYYPNFRSLTSLRTLVIQECKESESLVTCLSSSSSSSSFEHLEYVKILKIKKASVFEKEEVVFEWGKSEFFKATFGNESTTGSNFFLKFI